LKRKQFHRDEEWEASIRRRLRLVMLLDAAEKAGLVPLGVLRLHSFAYFSNVLAPVWEMPAQSGRVLKRRGGPFYPALQSDLDRLVGMGVVLISNLGYEVDDEGSWRIEGSYRLKRDFANRILLEAYNFAEERRTAAFLLELAYALSALSYEDLDRAMTEDATYSDPLIDFGSVVDFGEWQQMNYSANAARHFALPLNRHATMGEKLHFYVRHLRKRIHGGS